MLSFCITLYQRAICLYGELGVMRKEHKEDRIVNYINAQECIKFINISNEKWIFEKDEQFG